MTVTGNQTGRANVESNRTSDPLVSPVTWQDLADYLGLDPDPADQLLLDNLLLTACEFYIHDTANELLQRNYFLRLDRHPEKQAGFSGLGAMAAVLSDWVEFPLWPVGDVQAVEVNGEAIAEENYQFDRHSKPGRLLLDSRIAKDIVIDYLAGYKDADQIPKSAINGILMLAAYLYEHRGECDIDNAVKQSGAASIWQTQKMYTTL